jgi:hypothetical protein
MLRYRDGVKNEIFYNPCIFLGLGRQEVKSSLILVLSRKKHGVIETICLPPLSPSQFLPIPHCLAMYTKGAEGSNINGNFD